MWRRAAWSNGEMRTRRCTPASAAISPKAYSPVSVKVALLMPGLFAGLVVEHLALEAAALRPLEVHAQQHLGPVLRLGAAGARVDGHDGVGAVVLAAEHLLDLGGLDFAPRARRAPSAGRRRRPRPAPPTRAARRGRRACATSELRSSTSSASRRRRCSALCASAWLFQKSGAATRASIAVSSLVGVGGVKDSSAGRWRVSPGLRSGGPDLRARESRCLRCLRCLRCQVPRDVRPHQAGIPVRPLPPQRDAQPSSVNSTASCAGRSPIVA